jgi:hypothetical protein
MASKSTPAVRHLRYEVTNSATPGTETSHYVDIARDLAAINRRMMAQGRVYHVSKVTVVSRNTIAGIGWIDYNGVPGGATVLQQNAGFISVSVAPDSWAVRGAVAYGRQLYNKMRKKAQEASSGKNNVGKYDDFKIRGLHGGATAPTFLVPVDNGGNSLSLGEWDYSTYYSPDGTTAADAFTCHLLGPHAGTAGAINSVGLVESFGRNRATVPANVPGQPTEYDDDPMSNLFDDGTSHDEILQDVENRNDQPPYDQFAYGGDADNMPRPLVVQQGTLGQDGRVTLGGFAAVAGLIEFEVTSPIAEDVYSILVELKSGPYKGIAAEAL